MATSEGISLEGFLGKPPVSSAHSSLLEKIRLASSSSISTSSDEPVVKAYSDIVYLNYLSLGFSLSFEPSGGYTPGRTTDLREVRTEAENERLVCVGVDVYNQEEGDDERDQAGSDSKARKRKGPGADYSPFPSFPILLPIAGTNTDAEPFPLIPATIGKEVVSRYGEPTRKGGGESGTSMGVWTEWIAEGIMLEWRSTGLGAWEKGGEARWSVLSLFQGGKEAGEDPEDGKVGI